MVAIDFDYNKHIFNFLPAITYWDASEMSDGADRGWILSIGWLSWSLDFDYFGDQNG